jgi:molybdopterin synthase sulfur carrier subunit
LNSGLYNFYNFKEETMRIRAYATLRDLLGASRFDMSLDASAGVPTTVGQVLHRLAEAHPALAGKLWAADGHLTGYVTVLLNGRSVEYLQGMSTPIADDDTLSLFPPVGGG